MGISKYFYLGPYIRVWWSEKITQVETISTCSSNSCPKHGEYSNENFCSRCGAPIQKCPVEKIYNGTVSDFLEEHFGDIDFFFEMRHLCLPYSLIMPNRSQQGGISIKEPGEYFLPAGDLFAHDDWRCLIAKFKEHGVRFEQKIGALYYEY